MKKYVIYSLILGFIVIVLAYIYYELFNQFLVAGNDPLESNNTTIQFILLITGIVTIFFLYINYDLQRKQIKSQQEELDKNRTESEFNKIVQLVQNQLLFTKESLKDKQYESINLKRINDIAYAFTGFYYDLMTIIYRQVNIYKRFLNNSLNEKDKSLIFSLICTNFLDYYIDDVKHIDSLYENIEGNLNDKIDNVINIFARNSYAHTYYMPLKDVTKEKALSDNPAYWDEQRSKLYYMKNMVFDIKQTYDLHTNLLSQNN